MFTLGNKEAIVNGPSVYPITVTGTKMTIAGFGAFEAANVQDVKARRFTPEVLSSMDLTVPSAADLGIGATEKRVAVVTHIRMTTSRHSSEYATDFIKRGRPFVFELNVDGGETGDQIAAKLDAAFDEYNLRFNLSAGLPFTSSVAGAVITLTGKEGHLAFGEHVEFLKREDTFGLKATVANVVVGEEARYDGKYLEENVRMSNSYTSDSYAIAPGELPVIGGEYTYLQLDAALDEGIGIDGSWEAHDNIGGFNVSTKRGSGVVTFTLYFNEAATFGAGGQLDTILTFLYDEVGIADGQFLKADGTAAAGADTAAKIADFKA